MALRTALSALLSLLLAGPLFAAREGEYFREDRNLGQVDRGVDRIEGLLFWLKSDAGVEVDEQGHVVAWTDASGRGHVFEALPGAAHPARLTPGVVRGRPALTFTAAQHKPGGLVNREIGIDPAKGLSLVLLARVAGMDRHAFLVVYGDQYRTKGSLGIGSTGYETYGKSWWRVVADSEELFKSTDDNIAGKGFVLFVAAYDPGTKTLTAYQDGVQVGQRECDLALAPGHPFGIGAEPRGQWSFGGEVLEALAYNHAMDRDEVRALTRAILSRHGLGGAPVSSMAPLLPFAYYPSRNQMEVAVELSPDLLRKAGTTPGEVRVRVRDAGTRAVVATGTVPLDAQARGQALFDVPDLPDGEYAVEYVIGRHVEISPKTFRRIHFPFETSSLGEEHEVYPPFTPVEVEGASVSVVGRTYTLNAFGLFDQVTSLGRPLLAGPIALHGRTGAGPIRWQPGALEGKRVHDDEALFHAACAGSGVRVRTRTVIQEDGCARIDMILKPGADRAEIERLVLEIPFRDREAPLFHYVADNGMRFNYAGRTPRGGTIEWYSEPWDGWVPIRWRVRQPGPDDGVIWTGAHPRQHGNTQRWDHRPFAPYIWLGAEQRGLAFFMESERGFETDYRTPVQQLIRRGDEVILRVEIFQRPVTLTRPRRLTFGLMASPGKPMEERFRTRTLASGIGPVSCWGGWQCSSKYPDHRDWTLVDRIQEIRRRGEYTEADQQWFEAKAEDVRARWPERKINGSSDWLWLTTLFARRAAEKGAGHSGTYFEEHATDPLLPEWQVFQDEWASSEFNRFRERSANWGVFSPSYHDFALYMANEWMRRGVSLYFDNTNPKRCYNERFGPAFRGPDGALRYGISLFGQRRYYRRVYKLLSKWNEKGAPYPVDFTLHITNTQTLPFNTWATATLDLEQRAHTLNPEFFPPETEMTVAELTAGRGRIVTERARERHAAREEKARRAGYQLPWPPDYTRTVTFGRQVGAIPLALDFVSGHSRHHGPDYTPAMVLRNWAMRRLHDIRAGALYYKSAARARDYEALLLGFGYGDADRVAESNYWEPDPAVRVGDPRIKWMALTRRDPGADPFGLLLLQSYTRADAVTAQVTLPGAAALVDVETRERIAVAGDRAAVTMPANFSTRMFLAVRDPERAASLARSQGIRVEDLAPPPVPGSADGSP